MKKLIFTILAISTVLCVEAKKSEPMQCFDTGSHTVQRLRFAQADGEKILVGSDYDGVIVAMDIKGKMLWTVPTSDLKTYNNDLWCGDATGDGIDEIYAANGDGVLYAFDIKGNKLWEFCIEEQGEHRPPMYSVCTLRAADKSRYIVCASFDTNNYYLSPEGKLVKTIACKEFSTMKPFDQSLPQTPNGTLNYVRPIPLPDGSDLLLTHLTTNQMQSQGMFYILKPLSSEHHFVSQTKLGSELSSIFIEDPDGDGVYDLIYGASSLQDARYARLVFDDATYTNGKVETGRVTGKKVGGAAYRVSQIFPYYKADGDYDFAMTSARTLFTFDKDAGEVFAFDTFKERLDSGYAHYDVCISKEEKLLAVASSMEGGSCIYLFDTTSPKWIDAYVNRKAEGKLKTIMDNADLTLSQIKKFKKPEWQRDPERVVAYEGYKSYYELYNLKNEDALVMYDPYGNNIKQDRSWRLPFYEGNIYADKHDRRMKYTGTAEYCAKSFKKFVDSSAGMSTWAGHGNDPLYYQPSVIMDVADYAHEQGKSTIFLWPELGTARPDFKKVFDNHIMPIAEHLQKVGGHISFRSKGTFFQGEIYAPVFEKVIRGEYSHVFIGAMEETTDKSQDLSIAGRMGLWMAGSLDGWAVRCSRDDTSFDRMRQFSSHRLGNHILRKTVYALASGAHYAHNGIGDQNEVWLKLINDEVLFVPKREEILSISPVHISMHNPDEEYMHESMDVKWTMKYDLEKENENPLVFSHLNGSWLGGKLAPWDFSYYASGLKERRLNPIPPFPNGMVLITPVQNGALADEDAPRGKLVDKMHPIYRDIMKEYITNGRDYISADGKTHYKADEFYKTVAKDIEEGAKKLPINVTGIDGYRVGWVVAQMDELHLRVTLVDGGYINPQEGSVKVTFNGIEPVEMVDVLSGEKFSTKNGDSVEVEVPCGSFRFINVTLSEPLVK